MGFDNPYGDDEVFSGCPMEKDDLTGNMATKNVLQFFDEMNVELDLDRYAFNMGFRQSKDVFPLH